MVQVLQTRRESPLTKLLTGFGTGLGEGLQKGIQQFQQGQAFEKLGLPKGLASLDPEIQKAFLKQRSDDPFASASPEELQSLFTRLGVPKDQAAAFGQLYPKLSTGGKTHFAAALIDRIQRGEAAVSPEEFETFQEKDLEEQRPSVEVAAPLQEKAASLSGIKIPTKQSISGELFKNLTPKERVSREKDLYKENLEAFRGTENKLRGSESERFSLDTVETLNEKKGALPSGVKRLILVDGEGKLRWPFLANADTQQFVKLVNDFTTKAKDTYGARVTNFELDRFMQRLPTLSNTTEGRRQIVAYMKAVNDMNKVYYDSLKKVYNHYGLRGVDEQKATEIAETMGGKKLEEARKRLMESDRANALHVAKKNLKPGYKVVSHEGKYKYVREDQVDEALAQGAELR